MASQATSQKYYGHRGWHRKRNHKITAAIASGITRGVAESSVAIADGIASDVVGSTVSIADDITRNVAEITLAIADGIMDGIAIAITASLRGHHGWHH